MSSQKKSNNSPISQIIVPQMGEGLREVTIIRFLKNIGDKVEKDEVLYEMETDKSVFEIEAGVSGELSSWNVNAGDIVAVGVAIGSIKVLAPSHQNLLPDENQDIIQPTQIQNDWNISMNEHEKELFRKIPPRTRSYCQKANISLSEMLSIPFSGTTLLPIDVDNFIENRRNDNTTAKSESALHQDVSLSEQQKILNARFKSSQKNVISATLVTTLERSKLENAANFFRTHESNSGNTNAVPLFQVFAYCVVQACVENPLFRSILLGKSTRREFAHVNLGVAVKTQKNDLVTAVIPSADKLNFNSFINDLQNRVVRALNGEDQTKLHPSVILSYMGDCGVVWGSPLLVDPAIALLFLGSPYPPEFNYFHLSMTIDHRIVNGPEAAKFLQSIKTTIETLSNLAASDELTDGLVRENALF